MEAQEIIARALCRAEGDDPDMPCFDVKGPDGPLWSHRTFDARTVMRALNEAGYVIAPKHPTPDMKMAGRNVVENYDLAHECWVRMLAFAPEHTKAEPNVTFERLAPHGAKEVDGIPANPPDIVPVEIDQ